MASRYREITIAQFTETMKAIGFGPVELPGVHECVFERPFGEKRFSVRVYSSISTSTGLSRENGTDAIRVVLHDNLIDVTSHSLTVHRTVNALTNVVLRCREVWEYKNKHRCKCGAIMVERKGKKGKFLGCSAFSKTKCAETRPL